MPKQDIPTRQAGLYMRISRDVTGEALGVARQEEDCRALAERLGWDVAEVYVDNDISATSGKPRPAYRRMLADLEAGRIDAIIAWHPDRLYRRAVDLGELVEAVQRNKTPVATANAGDVDLNSPTGLLVAEMLAAIAMYEVRHKSERWTRSWRQGRESGQVARTGSRMFGYTREGQLIAAEAEIARRMAADIVAGIPILAVSRWLQDEGVTTTRGSTWRPGTVRQYLANPRIAGWSTLNGDIVGEGNWEPILDRETWEAVRALLASRTRSTPPRVSVLNGLIYCGKCTTRLVTGQANRGDRIYRCPKRPGFDGCGGVGGQAGPIEAVVEAYAAARLADPRVVANLGRLRAEPATNQAEIAALEIRLTELEKQLDEPGVPVATILRAIDRAKERQEKLLAQVSTLPPTEIPTGGADWPDDLRRRRALIELVVEKVTLNPATAPSRHGFDPRRIQIQSR